ncbi:hypothetical protein CQA53_04155 [Helicobacter didelphidarum]|uniref:Lipoprotein n=1 Tax=Helicobacter didelphidarum TaxID=2040648 RepID=A0A3D8IMJ0_9HELI|nr:hypothetical protein [Helicobacter didelphidarum]RDU66210.1 hypothetical protein CQA53_04155 [Helicobacter didelphidarum]
MKKLSAKVLPLVAIAFFLNACGGGIPSCSDKVVQDVLSNIILENNFAEWQESDRKKIKLSYSGFMTEMTDEKSRTNYCKANVKSFGKNTKIDSWITYTARYTDDKKEVYVELESWK